MTAFAQRHKKIQGLSQSWRKSAKSRRQLTRWRSREDSETSSANVIYRRGRRPLWDAEHNIYTWSCDVIQVSMLANYLVCRTHCSMTKFQNHRVRTSADHSYNLFLVASFTVCFNEEVAWRDNLPRFGAHVVLVDALSIGYG